MSTWDIDEFSCDRCGAHTENGNGHYLDELGTEDRICTGCYEVEVTIGSYDSVE